MILPIVELIEWLIARGGIELINLGKLKEIKDLRKVWPHEAIDFTPWLAEEDNLALLADAVGLEITVDETESSVGDFNVDIYATETGTDRKIIIEKPDSGNIDKVCFYVCPSCGNILVSTGRASIFCCGRKLERVLPTVATIAPKITVEEIDTDYFVTFDHPMTKDHYLSFVACVKSDRVFLNRLYPEQSPTCRFPITTGGKLFVYCIKHGLSVYSGNL